MNDPAISSPLQFLLVLAVASIIYFLLTCWDRRR